MDEYYFVDTSYIIALASKKDENHNYAFETSKFIKNSKIKLLTSEFIIIELCNSFSKSNLKNVVIDSVNSIYMDNSVEIIKLNGEYYQLGIELFCKVKDKNWSLVDCISFEILKAKNIKNVLTFDKHFVQAGFNLFTLN